MLCKITYDKKYYPQIDHCYKFAEQHKIIMNEIEIINNLEEFIFIINDCSNKRLQRIKFTDGVVLCFSF